MKNILELENGNIVIYADGYYEQKRNITRNGFKANYPFVFGDKCPTFEKFLKETLSEKDIWLLLNFIAYCLIPGQKSSYLPIESKALFLCGNGHGKTLITNIIRKLLGKKSCSSLDSYDFKQFALANLEFKFVNIGLFEEGTDLECIKNIENTILENKELYIYQHFGTSRQIDNFRKPKLIFEVPFFPKEINKNLQENFLRIDFKNEISAEKMDFNLEEKISKELSGILNLILKQMKEIR